MTIPLIIVESQAKFDTLKDQLKNEAEVLMVASQPTKVSFAAGGATDEIVGISFIFPPLPQEKDFIDNLRAAREREIFLALNDDQQGEYWAWMINGYLTKLTGLKHPPRRMHLLGLRHDEALEGMRQASPSDKKKGAVIHVRSLFNTTLVGQIQKLIGTKTGPGGLPFTYNSVTTTFLLTGMEEEIQAYSPVKKWQVHVNLSSGPAGEFKARLEKAPGCIDGGYFKLPAQGKAAVDLFKDLLVEVVDVKKRSLEVPPPDPFTITDLLEDAYIRFGMGPKAVMAAVRQLFYGVQVNGDSVGLISSLLPKPKGSFTELEKKIRGQAEKEFGQELLFEEPESFIGDEGFLLPLDPALSEKELAGKLPDESLKIYELIRRRALASQLVSAVEEAVDVYLQAGPECYFRTSCRTLQEEGFMAVYHEARDAELFEPCLLTAIEPGQTASIVKIIPEQTAGFPREHYSFGSLFAELADFSVNPDFSSISMLQAMLDNGYLSIGPQAELRAGENAFKVAAVMKRVFPAMQGINLSAYLEQTTEEALSGRKELGFALRQFDQTLTKHGKVLVKADISAKLRSRRRQVSSRIISKIREEPIAESPKSVKNGVSESQVAQAEEVLPAAEREPEDLQESEVVAATSVPVAEAATEATTGPEEEGLPEREALAEPGSDLPGAAMADGEDATAEIFEETLRVPPPEQVGDGSLPTPAGLAEKVDAKAGAESILCPVCRKHKTLNKRTPTGKDFYVCPGEECEFMAWAKPHATPCQVCDSPFMVEKKNIRGQKVLRCPRAGCGYMEPLPGEEGGDAPVKKRRLVRRVAKKGGTRGGKRKVVVRRR